MLAINTSFGGLVVAESTTVLGDNRPEEQNSAWLGSARLSSSGKEPEVAAGPRSLPWPYLIILSNIISGHH